MIDMHTIGAGGGSIAHVDPTGAFHVGPRSAGAIPGPAAYGRGGNQPTVTDANLQLGRLDADHFLGGGMRLDGDAAAEVIGALATRLGLAREEAAEGVLTVLNANMANAIRSRTVEKGLDPRDFTLVAMGGAGPLHGAEVAAMLGIPEVLVPRYPGIASAIGLMTTDPKYDTSPHRCSAAPTGSTLRCSRPISPPCMPSSRAQLRADGIDPDATDFQRSLDLRYLGQGYELRIAAPDGTAHGSVDRWAAGRFSLPAPHRIRSCLSRRTRRDREPAANGDIHRYEAAGRAVTCSGSLAAALVGRAPCVFRTPAGLRSFDTPRYERDLLPLEQEIAGPAIILQADSTTIVPPQAQIKVLDDGNLIIRFKES